MLQTTVRVDFEISSLIRLIYFFWLQIVFYLSGSLLVLLNSVVFFFRLSKPAFDQEEEEGEEEESVIEAKIQETVRQQHEKRFQQRQWKRLSKCEGEYPR